MANGAMSWWWSGCWDQPPPELDAKAVAYASAMTNIYKPTFEEGERPEGFRSRRARIGYELSTELSEG
jgi:hypothetical protein